MNLLWKLREFWYRKKINQISAEMDMLPTPRGWHPNDWRQIGDKTSEDVCIISL